MKPCDATGFISIRLMSHFFRSLGIVSMFTIFCTDDSTMTSPRTSSCRSINLNLRVAESLVIKGLHSMSDTVILLLST